MSSQRPACVALYDPHSQLLEAPVQLSGLTRVFVHDFTCVLNPSFFWGVQMEFSIQNEINSFHLFCNTIRLL
jgi:hypothetical protein